MKKPKPIIDKSASVKGFRLSAKALAVLQEIKDQKLYTLSGFISAAIVEKWEREGKDD